MLDDFSGLMHHVYTFRSDYLGKSIAKHNHKKVFDNKHHFQPHSSLRQRKNTVSAIIPLRKRQESKDYTYIRFRNTPETLFPVSFRTEIC